MLFHSDRMGERPLIAKVPRYFKKYMDFFVDLCQQEFAFQQYSPSMLAAAIVAASRRALRIVYVLDGVVVVAFLLLACLGVSSRIAGVSCGVALRDVK